MVHCVAYGCSNKTTTKREKKLSFFRFPRNEGRRNEWVCAVKRLNWKPNKHSFLCIDHFLEDDIEFTYTSGPRLKQGAIPKIFDALPVYLKPSLKLEKTQRIGRCNKRKEQKEHLKQNENDPVHGNKNQKTDSSNENEARIDEDNWKSVNDDISVTLKQEVLEVCVEPSDDKYGVAEKMRFRLLNILGKTLTPHVLCDSAPETSKGTNSSSENESEYILPDRSYLDNEVETTPCELKVKVESDNALEESSWEDANCDELDASDYFVKEENIIEKELDDSSFVKQENSAEEVSVPCKFMVGTIK